MNDARSVFCRHIVAGYHAERAVRHLHKVLLAVLAHEHLVRVRLSIVGHILRGAVAQLLARLHPRHQLRVLHAHQLGAGVGAGDSVGHNLVAVLVVFHGTVGPGGVEIAVHAFLCHNDRYALAVVRIERLHRGILELRPHAERRVRRQSPRRGGPGGKTGRAPLRPLCLRVENAEQGRGRGVLHVAVAARLVQLVRAEPGACGRRIGLDGVALIEQTLVIQLAEQPPQGLHILVVVGDVGVVKVNEIAHILRQLAPLGGELHHVLAAAAVVVLH